MDTQLAGSDGGPRRFTEAALDEQSLPVLGGRMIRENSGQILLIDGDLLLKFLGVGRELLQAWFKSWVFQVTVRTVPVPQPGTLAVRS